MTTSPHASHEIQEPTLTIDSDSWSLRGQAISINETRMKDLKGLFKDEKARARLPEDMVVYQVQSCQPVKAGTVGGLFFGSTTIQPGNVGNEYFMTRGHHHAKRSRAEFYWGVSGDGVLLLMGTDRVTRAERVFPGSLHYIPGNTAHRLVNTGQLPLVVGACWHADAGHEYKVIYSEGFSARVFQIEGKPELVPEDGE